MLSMKRIAAAMILIPLLAGCGEYRYDPETLEVPDWAKGIWYSNEGSVVSITDKDISLDSKDPDLADFSVLVMLDDDYYISSQHLAEGNDVWTLELGSFGDGPEMEINLAEVSDSAIRMTLSIEGINKVIILFDKPFNDPDSNS